MLCLLFDCPGRGDGGGYSCAGTTGEIGGGDGIDYAHMTCATSLIRLHYSIVVD